ncbi:hypothetical protein BWI97_16640 [Siphonobacter sp. BAB-5405]|uniref:hypothetical protein n=1 Tax=Siphonobacter sp. BAB-5405 TaxID=1864825 RepID=UPI000C80DB0A|nr:hypothetical protein [Siphonobacter sp. BAB-5405]PMD94337.1 hypothetical protein BWI97_16640 [Siphonobacter sp. BAB-5405]
MKNRPSELFTELPASRRSLQPVPDFLQATLNQTLFAWQLVPDTDPWQAGIPFEVLAQEPILAREKRLEWHTPALPPSDLEYVDALELRMDQPLQDPIETYLQPIDAQRLALYFSGNVDFLALCETLDASFPYPIHGGFAAKPQPEFPGFELGLLRKTDHWPEFRPFRLMVTADGIAGLSHGFLSIHRWLQAFTDTDYPTAQLLSKVQFSFERSADILLDCVCIRAFRLLLAQWQEAFEQETPTSLFIHVSQGPYPDWLLAQINSYTVGTEEAEPVDAYAEAFLQALTWYVAQKVWAQVMIPLE